MMTTPIGILMPPLLSDSPYHAPEVIEWVRAAQNGDSVAFGHLVERFQRDVYGKAFSILKNHQDADDATQETFIRAHRALPGFRSESSFRTWIITIATRQALNLRERTLSHPSSLDDQHEGQEPPALIQEGTQMAFLLDEEARRLMRKALPRLPQRQREALSLRLKNDWTYERIAREMGTSVGSVKAHIFHAIQNLTRFIRGDK